MSGSQQPKNKTLEKMLLDSHKVLLGKSSLS